MEKTATKTATIELTWLWRTIVVEDVGTNGIDKEHRGVDAIGRLWSFVPGETGVTSPDGVYDPDGSSRRDSFPALRELEFGSGMAKELEAAGPSSPRVCEVLKRLSNRSISMLERGLPLTHPSLIALDEAYMEILEWAFGPEKEVPV